MRDRRTPFPSGPPRILVETTLRTFLLLLAHVLLAANTPADTDLHYVLDAAHSDIRAKVPFLGLGSQTARFPEANGHIALDPAALEAVKMEVTLDARALTANGKFAANRLKGPSFLDVSHYPELHFVGRHLEIVSEKAAKLAGSVTAHGVTRPVTLDVSFSEQLSHVSPGEAIKLHATMTINRDDFGMTAYHLIVGRMVTITIDATMVPA